MAESFNTDEQRNSERTGQQCPETLEKVLLELEGFVTVLGNRLTPNARSMLQDFFRNVGKLQGLDLSEIRRICTELLQVTLHLIDHGCFAPLSGATLAIEQWAEIRRSVVWLTVLSSYRQLVVWYFVTVEMKEKPFKQENKANNGRQAVLNLDISMRRVAIDVFEQMAKTDPMQVNRKVSMTPQWLQNLLPSILQAMEEGFNIQYPIMLHLSGHYRLGPLSGAVIGRQQITCPEEEPRENYHSEMQRLLHLQLQPQAYFVLDLASLKEPCKMFPVAFHQSINPKCSGSIYDNKNILTCDSMYNFVKQKIPIINVPEDNFIAMHTLVDLSRYSSPHKDDTPEPKTPLSPVQAVPETSSSASVLLPLPDKEEDWSEWLQVRLEKAFEILATQDKLSLQEKIRLGSVLQKIDDLESNSSDDILSDVSDDSLDQLGGQTIM